MNEITHCLGKRLECLGNMFLDELGNETVLDIVAGNSKD